TDQRRLREQKLRGVGFGGRAWIVSDIPEWPFAPYSRFSERLCWPTMITTYKNNVWDLPLSGKLQSDLIQLEHRRCRCRKRNYAMSVMRRRARPRWRRSPRAGGGE